VQTSFAVSNSGRETTIARSLGGKSPPQISYPSHQLQTSKVIHGIPPDQVKGSRLDPCSESAPPHLLRFLQPAVGNLRGLPSPGFRLSPSDCPDGQDTLPETGHYRSSRTAGTFTSSIAAISVKALILAVCRVMLGPSTHGQWFAWDFRSTVGSK